MRYIYNFNNYTDILIRKSLNKSEFKDFISEIRNINAEYNYKIFLVGSYLDHLVNPSNHYNDIDFIITAKKIIDLNVLSEFMKKFHELCKQKNVAYDLMYLVDATEDDLNTDATIPAILGIEESRIITLYKSKHPKKLTAKQFIQMTAHQGTDLFEGILKTSVGINSILRRSQTSEHFPLPIKIT